MWLPHDVIRSVYRALHVWTANAASTHTHTPVSRKAGAEQVKQMVYCSCTILRLCLAAAAKRRPKNNGWLVIYSHYWTVSTQAGNLNTRHVCVTFDLEVGVFWDNIYIVCRPISCGLAMLLTAIETNGPRLGSYCITQLLFILPPLTLEV